MQTQNTETAGRKRINIIGGGSAALAFAAFIDTEKFEVHLFERNKTTGRKFLVAGDGGFNLTHGSPIEAMIACYEPSGFLEDALRQFSNGDLRLWLKSIGIPTFEGSSHRIYPVKGIKPVQVLQALLRVIQEKGVTIHNACHWTGWDANGRLLFKDQAALNSDITVFSLGGGSWKVTGSDGHWLSVFKQAHIPVVPFAASNCAFAVSWPSDFKKAHAGKPLKNIALSSGGKTAKGEVVITDFGLEGNAIYALSTVLQTALTEKGHAELFVDFKPIWTREQILEKLKSSKHSTTQQTLKDVLHLSSTAIQTLKNTLSKEAYTDPARLSESIKALPLRIERAAPLDEAISSSGGVALKAIDSNFMLRTKPDSYCIGEMLDWNAPTGGYLLQACFSMGVALARHLNSAVK